MIVKKMWRERLDAYVPMQQAHRKRTKEGYIVSDIILEAAREFLEANPTCPYSHQALAADYVGRMLRK